MDKDNVAWKTTIKVDSYCRCS